jgi:hypothetical protein
MNEKQLRDLNDYLERRIAVQKELLNKSERDESYHTGAIMELMGVQGRILFLITPPEKKQP